MNSALTRVSVTLSTIVVALVLLLPATGHAEVDVSTWDVHVVRSGDTLWEIASAATPAGHDVRVTVSEIREANDLEGSLIHPGQRLHVPPEG